MYYTHDVYTEYYKILPRIIKVFIKKSYNIVLSNNTQHVKTQFQCNFNQMLSSEEIHEVILECRGKLN